MHFGIHKDDQNRVSLVKEIGKSRREEGLANKVDERAELSFPLSRSLGQEHVCEQVRCHGPNFKGCFVFHFAYCKGIADMELNQFELSIN